MHHVSHGIDDIFTNITKQQWMGTRSICKRKYGVLYKYKDLFYENKPNSAINPRKTPTWVNSFNQSTTKQLEPPANMEPITKWKLGPPAKIAT